MASLSNKNVVFRVVKYARLSLPSTTVTTENFSQMEKNEASSEKEQWILYESEGNDMHLCISEQLQFTLRKGEVILENLSLVLAKDSIRVTAKGDSILVICKTQEQNRKFRLQFASENGKSGPQQCKECVKILAIHVHVKTSSQAETLKVASCPTTLVGMTDVSGMAKALLDPKRWRLLGTCDTQLDSSRLEEDIAFCLLDPSFPSFVDGVEKFLNTLLSDSETETTQNQ